MHKLAFVTGASSGIGEALCHLLADKGINLLITGRDAEKLEQLAEALKDKVNVEACPADLFISQERKQLLEKIRERTPDLVINNAGFGLYGDVLELSTEEQLDLVRVNVEAVVEITVESARVMKNSGQRGVIINISSVAAFQVFPLLSAYAASKGFVLQFSESVDIEMEKYGIRVLTSCPGRVGTPFSNRASKGRLPADWGGKRMSVEYAAQQVWRQIEKRKAVHLFNWKYRLGAFVSRYLLPKRLVAKILMRVMRGR